MFSASCQLWDPSPQPICCISVIGRTHQDWRLWSGMLQSAKGAPTNWQNYVLTLLVGGFNPSENISQLGLLFPIYGKIKFMLQTTNQNSVPLSRWRCWRFQVVQDRRVNVIQGSIATVISDDWVPGDLGMVVLYVGLDLSGPTGTHKWLRFLVCGRKAWLQDTQIIPNQFR